MLRQATWMAVSSLLILVPRAAAVPLGGVNSLGSLGAGGLRMLGGDTGHEAGFSLDSAGDFNGDGITDWIVGAPNASPLGRGDAGEAYLIYGQFGSSVPTGTIDLDTVGFGQAGVRFQGGLADERTGYSVASAGDVNGDGIGDVLIGARRSDIGDDREGRTYLIYGKSGGAALSGAVDLAQVGSTIDGAVFGGIARRDQAGTSVASAGDVNGDGLSDLIIGAPSADLNGSNSGEAFLVYGQSGGATLTGAIALADVGGSVDGARVVGTLGGDNAGIRVATAGDFNSDGLDDLLIGANFADPGGLTSAGNTYLIYGQSGPSMLNGLLQLDDVGSTIAGAQLEGASFNDRSGTSLGTAGDVNGDGIDDLLVGSPNDTGPPAGIGLAQLVYGQSGGSELSGNIALGDVGTSVFGAILAGVAGDLAGTSVAAVGDVDGDGIDDFLVGEPLGDSGQIEVGRTYLIYGQPTATPITGGLSLADVGGAIRGAVFEGIFEKDHAGKSVAGAGDVNGDGLADLLIGASDAAPNQAASGEAYLVFGRRGPDVRWIAPGDGDWDDPFAWLGFEGPAAGDRVTISPIAPAVIAGPAASVAIDQLTIDGVTLELVPGVSLTTTQGVTILSAGALSGGTLAMPAIVDGDLDNQGLLDIGGSVGAIEVTGTYLQSGVLRIEVDSDTEFDRLLVGEDATLDGLVEIDFNYTPAATTDYRFLVATEIFGNATFLVTGLDDPTAVSMSLADGSFRFTAAANTAGVPEPGALGLVGSLLVLPGRRRRRAAACRM